MTHECPLSRSIGYFLEPVVMLAPFSKKPLSLTLKGITTNDHDLSVSFTPVDYKSVYMLTSLLGRPYSHCDVASSTIVRHLRGS